MQVKPSMPRMRKAMFWRMFSGQARAGHAGKGLEAG
jgi:hypothetical protein